ncbi:hypothetical protein JCM10207_007505 [Rhodosporidiobolus poonsookiae]
MDDDEKLQQISNGVAALDLAILSSKAFTPDAKTAYSAMRRNARSCAKAELRCEELEQQLKVFRERREGSRQPTARKRRRANSPPSSPAHDIGTLAFSLITAPADDPVILVEDTPMSVNQDVPLPPGPLRPVSRSASQQFASDEEPDTLYSIEGSIVKPAAPDDKDEDEEPDTIYSDYNEESQVPLEDEEESQLDNPFFASPSSAASTSTSLRPSSLSSLSTRRPRSRRTSGAAATVDTSARAEAPTSPGRPADGIGPAPGRTKAELMELMQKYGTDAETQQFYSLPTP